MARSVRVFVYYYMYNKERERVKERVAPTAAENGTGSVLIITIIK